MAKTTMTIRIDKDVFAALRALARAGFYESPNRVLRRLLGLSEDG
jgi:uncharacterized protein (DUF4415 family)